MVAFGPNCKDLESSFAWGQTDQGPGAGTSVYVVLRKPAPLWLWGCTFPLHQWLHFPTELNHRRCLAERSGADPHRPKQAVTQRSRWPASPAARLYHNWAVLHWTEFLSSPHPKLRFPFGIELGPMTMDHCWQKEFIFFLLPLPPSFSSILPFFFQSLSFLPHLSTTFLLLCSILTLPPASTCYLGWWYFHYVLLPCVSLICILCKPHGYCDACSGCWRRMEKGIVGGRFGRFLGVPECSRSPFMTWPHSSNLSTG